MDLDSEFQVRIEEVADRKVLYAEGELVLRTAERLRQALLETLQAGKTTVLEAGGITSLDLVGLQLLCSAHRTYCERGVRFQLEAVPPRFAAIARAAGFKDSGSLCPILKEGRCLWGE